MNSPIRISPNGRYCVDAHGAPFFWLGDTAWPLFGHDSRAVAEACLFPWSASQQSSTPDRWEDVVLAPDGSD